MSSSYADLSDCELRKCIQLLTSMPLPAENATRAQLLVKLRECFGDIGTDTEDAADVPGMVAVRNWINLRVLATILGRKGDARFEAPACISSNQIVIIRNLSQDLHSKYESMVTFDAKLLVSRSKAMGGLHHLEDQMEQFCSEMADNRLGYLQFLLGGACPNDDGENVKIEDKQNFACRLEEVLAKDSTTHR